MRSLTRRVVVDSLVVAVMAIGVPPAAAGPEGNFVNKINAARKANGKEPVQVYWDLRDDARAHARRMMEQGKVYTNPNIGSVTKGWKALAEVVGVGPSVSSLWTALWSSRKGTILGPYNYVGVGVAKDEDGILWVSMIFMKGPDGLVESKDTPDPTTTTTTTKAPSSTNTSSSGSSGGGPLRAVHPSRSRSNGPRCSARSSSRSSPTIGSNRPCCGRWDC